MAKAPIIVTATMGDDDYNWADGMRRTHYPPDRNIISAHITLFHHLPPSSEVEVLGRLARASEQKAPRAELASVMHLGRGVAYRIDSPGLMAIREGVADALHGLLTPQDQAKPRLHITIQNKVSAEESRTLCEALKAEFKPRPFVIAGLAAWRYLGGPWEPIRGYRFRG